MQVSWIDETDMTALLGRLREPVPPARTDDDFGDAGTLFEDPAPVPAPEPIMVKEAARIEAEPHADLEDFRSRLQAIRERAMGAGLLPQPMVQEEPLPAHDEEPEWEEPEAIDQVEAETTAPAPQTIAWPAFQPQGYSVMERLASFAAWAEPQLQGCELFIIDDQGDMIRGSSTRQELVLTMVMAWVASSRMSAVFAFNRAPVLRQPMASGGHLVAIPCPTRLGLLHLAITSEQPLPDEHLPELRHALISTMEAVE